MFAVLPKNVSIIYQYSGQNLSRFQASNPDSTVDGILLSKSEAKLTLIKLLDPGTASPESLVEPFKKMSGLLIYRKVAIWVLLHLPITPENEN